MKDRLFGFHPTSHIVALHCVGVGDDDSLDMEGCQPHVALGEVAVHVELVVHV